EQRQQQLGIQTQPASLAQLVGELVEGLQQAHLHRGVLLRLAELAALSYLPRLHRLRREEDADRERRPAIERDVEDELGRGRLRIVFERRALAHEIVSIDVAGLARVGLERRIVIVRHLTVVQAALEFGTDLIPCRWWPVSRSASLNSKHRVSLNKVAFCRETG